MKSKSISFGSKLINCSKILSQRAKSEVLKMRPQISKNLLKVNSKKK